MRPHTVAGFASHQDYEVCSAQQNNLYLILRVCVTLEFYKRGIQIDRRALRAMRSPTGYILVYLLCVDTPNFAWQGSSRERRRTLHY